MADSVYREDVARCPRCAVDMEAIPVGEETIDACPRCGGVWLDWYDGDVAVLVEGLGRPPRGPVGGPAERPTCPRCRMALTAEDARGETLVWRCRGCAGTFVPEESFAGVTAPDPPRSALGRLIDLGRRLIQK
jgi:Zn-finger nucleic acid-binding protein